MALAPGYLIDNSAYNRAKYPAVLDRIRPLVGEGVVATCGALEIEALYSARGPVEYDRLRYERVRVFTYLETDEADWRRALFVQRELAMRPMHRGPGIADLLIAAVAYRHGLALLHYDSDFDRIAMLTGQRAEWVVPRGSVP